MQAARDAQGNPMVGADAATAAAYDAALADFNLYRGDPLGRLDAALAEAPRFAMAALLKAWLLALATEPGARRAALAVAAEVRDWPLAEREASHLTALELLLAGEWTAAAVVLDHHSMRWPHDLAALQCGHLIDFFRAEARDLRDRIHRALPFWDADMPGHASLLGMAAFGLEECGDYARAEEAGRAALAAEPRDGWAHHAVAHVLEMQGRAAEGVAWMEEREAEWADAASFFRIHNWWHKALYHLDLGDAQAALAVYDGPVRGERSPLATNLVDASALLWRLSLAGVDPGARWAELAEAWEAHADGRLYPFNDWHAAMAWLGAGRMEAVDALLDRYAEGGESEVARWAEETGRDLIEGFRAFRAGAHAEAAARLHRARYLSGRFGGSHAQRDVIDLTLVEAAIRAGDPVRAAALSHERLALKPHSPLNRAFLARAADLRG